VSKFYEYKVLPLWKITPFAANSRTHSDSQVAQIAASIKEFGFTNPLLIDETGTIIAGHGRFEAALRLELDEVPVIELAGLTDAQRRAYVIADNKLALNAGWDDDMLQSEILSLKEMDFEIDLLGFDEDELSLLLNGWDSDINLPDEPKDDSLEMFRVKVDADSMDEAKEVITNALDDAGIRYEF